MVIIQLLLAVCCLHLLNVEASTIARIDPVTEFSAYFVSDPHTAFQSASVGDLSHSHSNERLRVQLSLADHNDFDLTLNLDPVITDRTRIIAGVPGDEHEIKMKPSSYSGTITKDDGTATIATFTVMPDGKLDGMIVSDGQIYMVTPLSFLEAEAASQQDSPAHQEARRPQFDTYIQSLDLFFSPPFYLSSFHSYHDLSL